MDGEAHWRHEKDSELDVPVADPGRVRVEGAAYPSSLYGLSERTFCSSFDEYKYGLQLPSAIFSQKLVSEGNL